MKTKRKTMIALVIIITVLAAVSCGKDPESGQNHDNTTDAQALRSGEQLLAQITDFGKLLESYDNGEAGRETRYMAVSEAVVNIESLFNYTFSNPDLCYGYTIALDTTLYMLVTPDDSVSVSELATFYGKMHAAVSALYHSITIPDQRFLVLDVEEGTTLNERKAILLHTVQGSVEQTPQPPGGNAQLDPGPFPPGVSWCYGENGGNSSYGGSIDAADTLSMAINGRLYLVPPEGMSYFYYDIRTPVYTTQHPYTYPLYPGVGPYCEFYKENPLNQDYWLSSDQMNFHFFGEWHLVRNILPNVGDNPVPTTHTLFQVNIQDFKEFGDDEVIGHHTEAFYGIKVLVAQTEHEKDL